jgi:hypothetical protein
VGILSGVQVSTFHVLRVCAFHPPLPVDSRLRSLAPSYAGSPAGFTEDHEHVEVAIMTGLQIAMSREIYGWPLYGIIMAAGQV